MKVVRSPDGRAILHCWRTGHEYEDQKGPVFLEECTNVKFVRLPHARGGKVNHHPFGRPLPLPDDTFDVAYTYHVLEHHTEDEAELLASEFQRVLKPGGMVRLSIADLEGCTRAYLEQLDICRQNPSKENIVNYRWALYHLVDQKVRQKPGGNLLSMIRSGEFDPDFVRSNFGDAYGHARPNPGADSIVGRERKKNPLNAPYALFRRLITTVKGRDPRILGEADLAGTDRLTTRLLLEKSGFVDIREKSFDQSDIEGWERFDFDRSNNGHYPLEGKSAYLEARKPGAS